MGKKLWLVLVPLLSLQAGCFLLKPSLRVEVSGHSDMNAGLPFHMLIRSVTATQFREESYVDLTRLVVQADKSVLRTQVLYAPRDKDFAVALKLVPPKEGCVGLYFLFTNPTGTWRMLLEPPLPRVTAVALGPGGILPSGASAP